MEIISAIGFSAGFLTTVSFIPQVIKAYREKHTSGVSKKMYMILVVGMCLWLTYGILLNEMPLIIANSISLFLAATVLVQKFIYG